MDDIVTLGREGIRQILTLGSPALLVGIIVGSLWAIFQATTQIQDQTISFVVKIVSMLIAIAIFLPWMTSTIVEYARQLLENIPETTFLLGQS